MKKKEESIWDLFTPRIHTRSEIEKWVSSHPPQIQTTKVDINLLKRMRTNLIISSLSLVIIILLSYAFVRGWYFVFLPVPATTSYSANEWHFAGITLGIFATFLTVFVYLPLMVKLTRLTINGINYYKRYELEIELRRRSVKK